MKENMDIIQCENPYEKVWEMLIYFESEPTVKSFLTDQYKKSKVDEPEKYAFLNTHKMIYFMKQAKEYFQTAKSSSILVSPLLMYYGMVSFIKAIVLSRDPHYPRQTEDLQHGMTARKLKKNHYELHNDEVRLKSKGLLPLLVHHIMGYKMNEKYKLKELFSQIPELLDAYIQLYRDPCLVPVCISHYNHLSAKIKVLQFPETVLDAYHLTYASFISFLNRYDSTGNPFAKHPSPFPKGTICIGCPSSGADYDSTIILHPLLQMNYKGKLFFRLKAEKRLFIPEICMHFMIMFVLGMLCRYDTELWGEMNYAFTSGDIYIVHEFLNLSKRKFPNLVLNLLWDKQIILQTN